MTKPSLAYANYIDNNVPQDPYAQAGNCRYYSSEMQKVFPELVLKIGYVSSPDNVDNIPILGHDKQYPHVWLETDSGEIVDPTVKQFILLGKLDYTVVRHPEKLHKCFICARFIDTESSVCDSQICIEAVEDY